MMKKIFIALKIIIISLVLFGLYKLSTFNLFDDETKIIKEQSFPDKTYKIKIYQIPSNAVTQSSIQIRKLENGVEEVLESYKRFNYLNRFFLNNDTLVLAISDTSNVKPIIEEKKFKLP